MEVNWAVIFQVILSQMPAGNSESYKIPLFVVPNSSLCQTLCNLDNTKDPPLAFVNSILQKIVNFR